MLERALAQELVVEMIGHALHDFTVAARRDR